MNIGDNVNYKNWMNETVSGVITEVSSDMDSYEDMRLEDGIPLYYSKKLSRYVPVKEKNMASVFVTVERSRIPNKNAGSVKEFVTLNELF
jgi:hypothetical protein